MKTIKIKADVVLLTDRGASISSCRKCMFKALSEECKAIVKLQDCGVYGYFAMDNTNIVERK